jgi:hypothetical protein
MKITKLKREADEIRQLHNEIMAAAKSSLEKGIRVGEKLIAVRDSLKHGEWLPWLKINAPFSDRTARNYIRLYENREQLKLETVSDLSGAYRLLSPPIETAERIPQSESPPLVDILDEITPRGFLPESGGLKGVRRNGDGTEDEVYLVQDSREPKFYYIVTAIADKVNGGWNMTATGKPVRDGCIVIALGLEGLKLFQFQWEEQPTWRMSFNPWMYASEADARAGKKREGW